MKKFLAELVATFALVFCGTGAIIVNNESNSALGLVGIAFTFGIIVIAMIYIFDDISGAHMNPSVTIALAIGSLMPREDVAKYISGQFVGAFLASGLLYFIFPESAMLGETLPAGSIFQSFLIELILTFFLMLTILGVSSKKEYSSVAGLIIGLIVVGIILVAGPISGGSFNPFRSIAPAVISGNISALWIYITAPTFGTVLAVVLWKCFDVKRSSLD